MALLFGALPISVLPTQVMAAERIYASYSVLERSISVDALETYAKEGKLDEDLAVYARYLKPEQLAQLRRVLLARADLSAVATSQFLYTPVGETLLQRLGQVIQTESRQPGFYALRGALILAAADPEGLTLLNVLRKFPTRSIRVDLSRSLKIAEQLKDLVNQTNQEIALIKQQSTAAATTPQTVDFSQLPDLRRRGRFSWNKQTLKLNDKTRDRVFLTDVYLPQQKAAKFTLSPLASRLSPGFPVIVISHGLGSDRTSFEYLAQHLASYGFAVAVPEHPGSSAEQLRLLLAGRSYTVAEPNEFINRPLDIKYLLNQLARLDASNSSFKLNLQQVGVIGQSFGGYTALALAGASLNFDQLQKDCEDLNESWNVSLLLQCRVLELPRTQYNLSDSRVKAALAINPITSSIFGKASLSKIKVPVMIVSSSDDTVVPALSEQIKPFTWLTTPQKYLAVIERGTHFSTIGETNPATDPFILPAQVIGPSPAIARGYMNALSLAFLQTYIAKAPQYRPYLSATYAQDISQQPLNLSLVQSLPASPLIQSFKVISE
ncbi:MAG: alpha/beta hydrolase [Gloeocapsa sp. UFS-A4-WI-NPMV-4B04]|jgi:predicted dienelactone hydrolase|nr:alpha/beta hydrolase [Gloeocapsa sp. UFS-A4-WI-NPMV-4B04]